VSATSVRIAPLEARHRPHIETIVRATGVFNEDEVGVALELFDAAFGPRLSALVDADSPDYEFVGAFQDESPVGYACFGQTPSTDRTYDLYWIAVHPDAQRTGAGRALMDEVEGRLTARQARLLVIETSSRDDYVPTRRFYGRRGYSEAARVRDFYDLGDDRVILTRRLSASAPARPEAVPQPSSRI